MTDGLRHELKFIISETDARLLKLRLKHIMEPDPHTGPTGRYTIRSLYFDDFSHSAFFEKADGICLRSKYRLRIYNQSMDTIKLEKKEKLGNLTRKTSQTVTADQVLTLQQSIRPDFSREGGLIEELGMKPDDYGFYMDLRKYGSARHAGFGLGFERCVMYLTGMGNIRDVLPFPRTVNNCEL